MEPPLKPKSTLGFLPEAERTTAYYLFSGAETYLVQAKKLELRSEEDIKFFGMPTSGDPYYDAEMANELVYQRMTINQMVEYFKENVTIGVVDRKDTKRIYDRISDHLVAWRTELSKVNHRPAPLEDLLLLDHFANKVYEHAKWHFQTTETQSHLAQVLGGRFGNRHFLQTEYTAPAPSLTTPPPARDSLKEVFAQGRRGATTPSINGTVPVNPFDIREPEQRLPEGSQRLWRGFGHGN